MSKTIFEHLDNTSREAIRKTAIVILSFVAALGFFFFVMNCIDRYFEWDFYSVLGVLIISSLSLLLMIKRKFIAGGSIFLFGIQMVLMAEPFMLLNDSHGLTAYLIGNALGLLILLFFAGFFVGQLQLIISTVLSIGDITVVSFLSGDETLFSASFYVMFALLLGGIFVFFINRLFLSFIRRAQEESNKKELLLRELHHRVKNNLQIISSMLNMQAEKVSASADRQLFIDTENRISALAIVHDHLYTAKDLELVRMGPYIRDLVAGVISAAEAAGLGMQEEYHLSEVTMKLQSAMLCGLIVTELVMNTIRHAFPVDRKFGAKKVVISLTSDGDGPIYLRVEDNGIGLTEGLREYDIHDSNQGIGFYIIDALVDQLHGEKIVSSLKGACYEIKIPRE